MPSARGEALGRARDRAALEAALPPEPDGPGVVVKLRCPSGGCPCLFWPLVSGRRVPSRRPTSGELMRKFHPDAQPNLGPVAQEEATQRFHAIQEAYEALTDKG